MKQMKKMAVVLLAALFLFGCGSPEWYTYTDGKFSMSYPAGDLQETEGDEIFKINAQGCQISVSKFEGQPSFSAFVDYIRGTWENVQGLGIESQYTGQTVADFVVRASNESNQFKGSIRIKDCGDDTIYVALVGCGRGHFDSNRDMVDRIIDSAVCS